MKFWEMSIEIEDTGTRVNCELVGKILLTIFALPQGQLSSTRLLPKRPGAVDCFFFLNFLDLEGG